MRVGFSAHLFFSAISLVIVAVSDVAAQTPVAKGNDLFGEDSAAAKDERTAERKNLLKAPEVTPEVANIRAPSVSFDKEKNVANASGGVLVSRGGVQVQADEVQYNLESDDATLDGQVLISGIGSTISAEKGTFNLQSETGAFNGADIALEGDGFFMTADEARKETEDSYVLEETTLTTCGCEDGSKPWTINASHSSITNEGYAYCRNTSLRVGSVPVFYSPYFAFPVKRERQSGLLIPSFGFSSDDGLTLRLPIFAVIDDSTDMTITPMIESKTRYGAIVDFRKDFSVDHKLTSRFIYSDERPRDGDLRGTVTDGVFDPEIEEDRFGGFIRDTWRSKGDASVPWSIATDVRYVADDLFIREIEDPDIAERSAQYATSRILGRLTLGEYGFAEVGAEYNQSMVSDDDLVLQRLPEATFGFSKSLRPFGFNPLGAKLNTQVLASAVRFDRDRGYDGLRTNINPAVGIPFHFKNYLQNEMMFSYNATYYSLDQNELPDGSGEIDDSNNRNIFSFAYRTSTSVERVYQLDQGNWLTDLSGLGVRSQGVELRRVKHTIEPFVNFTYVPDVSQDDLPLFDSFDRMREKSLATFGVSTRLLGRFVPFAETADSIGELSRQLSDVEQVSSLAPLGEFGLGDQFVDSAGVSTLRTGEVRELARFTVRQSYDYKEDKEDNDPLLSEWSDLGSEISLTPNPYFGVSAGNNFNIEESQVSSWGLTTQLQDDRGDVIRARYTYIRDQIGQLEGNLELKLSDRLKLGYYARYDDRESEFIENRVALRLKSACDCWHVDLGFSDRLNPDKQQVMLNFGLSGLGDFGQAFRLGGNTGK